MKLIVKYSLALILMLSCFSLSGQGVCGLLGYVHQISKMPGGNEMSSPVIEYDAMLITRTDTLNFFSKNGDFHFRDVTPGQARLIISKTGYMTVDETMTLTEGEQTITIELFRKGEDLKSAIVSADQPVITMKGDTLVYHASAVKRMDGDFAIDIISQMPGVEISDRGIKIGGRDISKAYVNGVLVFGRNPMDAIRNLAAEEVVTMNVYDEVTDEGSRTPEQKRRVINILTKNNIVEVVDVQSLLSFGKDKERDLNRAHQRRHIAGFSGNFFSESLLIKTDLLTNNVGVRQSISLSSDAFSTPTSALTSQDNMNSAAINVEKYWGRNYNTRTGLNISYSYSDNSSESPKKSIVEHFRTDLSEARTVKDSVITLGSSRTHSLKTGFQKSIRDVKMTWNNNVNYVETGRTITTDRQTQVFGATVKENSRSSENRDSWRISESISFNGRTTGNKLFYTMTVNLDADRGNGYGFILDTLRSSSSRRYLDKSGDDVNWNTGATFTLRRSLASPRYTRAIVIDGSSQFIRDKHQQTSMDLLAGLPTVDSFNTFDYTYNTWTNRIGVTYQRLYFHGGLKLSSSRIVGIERIPGPETSSGKTYVSLLPYLYIFNGKSLNIMLNSNVRIPSLEQIRQRIDNTNPMAVIAGNPNLRPEQIYNLSFSRNTNMGLNGLTITADITSHPIVRRQKVFSTHTSLEEYGGYIMPAGSMLYYYDNADWAMNTMASYSSYKRLNLKFIPAMTVNYILDASLSVMPAYLMDHLYRTTDMSGHGNLRMSYTANEKLRLILGADMKISRGTNTISHNPVKTLGWNYDVTVRYNPLQYLFMEASYKDSEMKVLGRGSTMDNRFLKVSVGTNLCGQKLKILVEGIDILNNTSMYSTAYTENSFTQRFTPVFGQYFLLSVKYRFNSSQNRRFNSDFSNNSQLLIGQ